MNTVKLVLKKYSLSLIYFAIITVNIVLLYYFYNFVNINIISPITIDGATISAQIKESNEEINITKLKDIIGEFDKKTTAKEKYIKNVFKN